MNNKILNAIYCVLVFSMFLVLVGSNAHSQQIEGKTIEIPYYVLGAKLDQGRLSPPECQGWLACDVVCSPSLTIRVTDIPQDYCWCFPFPGNGLQITCGSPCPSYWVGCP